MAELSLDLRHEPKDRAYAQVHAVMLNTLSGIDDDIAGMATVSALVHHAFRHLWTGFYRVVAPERLLIGPYQGTLGCLDIAFGRGVCGTAAAERRTIVVPDVSRFPGHISCDARARSEIVLPVFDPNHSLIAVFDIDSAREAAFDQQDANGLERILRWFAGEGRG
ncbi:MAG TPA: GAF domain-containing protein [Gemmatimonadaceae bacterium]|jgi:L-methionine (R)-S-oxide reductase|nr:GAF domain-containing protein [Gemmatimonadaceae bacterium]